MVVVHVVQNTAYVRYLTPQGVPWILAFEADIVPFGEESGLVFISRFPLCVQQ